MLIDNSRVAAHSFCAWKDFEQYEDGQSAALINAPERDFGTRFHELLEAHYTSKEPPATRFPDLEDEAQATLAAYIAHYPVEPFEVVETERVHVIPIPETSHSLVTKIDMLVRQQNDNRLRVLDTKTQGSRSQSNHPESWASRRQVGLYQWAAQQVYREEVPAIIINLIVRQSPAGRVGPGFERLVTYRTAEQQQEALRYVCYVADRIEAARKSGYWPGNRDNCRQGWKRCDYLQAHLTGWTDAQRALFRPAENYLGLTPDQLAAPEPAAAGDGRGTAVGAQPPEK